MSGENNGELIRPPPVTGEQLGWARQVFITVRQTPLI